MIEQRVILSIDREKWDSESARAWLKLALQCQKQCNETVKSRAAMDYMQSLIDQHKTSPLPRRSLGEGGPPH